MTIEDLIQKYGTNVIPLMLKRLATQLDETRDAHGYDVDMAVINEMASDLQNALTHHTKYEWYPV